MPKNEIIYKEPANIFVAKYIGKPEINITEAFLIRKKNKSYIKLSEDVKFRISPNREKWLKGYDKKNIYFGIRSEDIIEINNTSGFRDNHHFIAEKKGETKINSKKYDFLEIAGSKFIAEQKRKAKVGDNIKVSFNMDKCHIFDKKTEENVARNLKLIHFTK
ncbi:MAG: hypothetical protein ACQERZ_02455 [Fusobacteriota bacterium]